MVQENIDWSLKCIFHINPEIEWIIMILPFNLEFITCFPYYFFNPNFFYCFLQFIFVNVPKIFSLLGSLMMYVNGAVLLAFLTTKSF